MKKILIISVLLSGCNGHMPRFNPTPASAALMGFGAQMMRDSQPRALYAPPAQIRCYQMGVSTFCN